MIAINRFIIIINFRNCFNKALTEIVQFRRALEGINPAVRHRYLPPRAEACQTQTSLRAAKATKTAEGAAIVPKIPQWATFNKF